MALNVPGHSGEKPRPPSKSALPRRVILGATVASIAAGITALMWKKEEKETLGELALQQFPEELDGADSVEKHPAEDAEYCLVHIKQVHYSERGNARVRNIVDNLLDLPPDEKQILEEVMLSYYDACADEVQQDIGRILTDLHSRGMIQRIYIEGLTEDMIQSGAFEQTLGDARQQIQALRLQQAFNADPATQDRLSEMIEDAIRYGWTELVMDGKVEALPADDSEMMERVLGASDEEYEELQEERERALIERCVNNANADVYSIFTFGSIHDFTNHEGTGCALVVITPESLKRVDEADRFLSSAWDMATVEDFESLEWWLGIYRIAGEILKGR